MFIEVQFEVEEVVLSVFVMVLVLIKVVVARLVVLF